MIRAVFSNSRAVRITGHADFAAHGKDIVCAAVSSAFQLCANGITEVLQVNAKVSVGGNTAEIELPDNCAPCATSFIDALKLHLSILEEQYPEYIEIMEDEPND